MSIIPSGLFGTNPRSNIFDPFSTDLFDPFFNFPSITSDSTSQLANTRIDWRETQEAHEFKADIPGLRKEEVKVEVEDGGVLSIRGERKSEKEEKGETWHRMERSSGSFVRRFRLPENAKLDEVKAALDNGVLTVTVPKTTPSPPAVKSIDIN